MAERVNLDKSPWVPILMGAWLIISFLIAMSSHAGEFPPAWYMWFNLGLDVLLVAILALLVARAGTYPPGALRVLAMIVGGVGVLAGLGKIGIRFTSDHAWWTGDYLPPVF